MADTLHIEIDHAQFDRALAKLRPQQMKAVVRSTLTESARILQKETKQRIRSAVDLNRPAQSFSIVSGRKKLTVDKRGVKRLRTVPNLGVKVGRMVFKGLASTIKVHLLGDFRLKWLDQGTAERFTKGRHNRKAHASGAMPAKHFFFAAQKATSDKIFTEMKERLVKNVLKTAAKAGFLTR